MWRALSCLLAASWGAVAWAQDLPPGISAVESGALGASGTGLEALEGLLGQAPVVGVGERHHFSGGLEQARARVLAHGIEHLGVRLVGMEISWSEGRGVDAALQACTKKARTVPVPPTDRLWAGVDPLLQFACAFNNAHPKDPVRFFGFDIQDSWNHRARVEDWLGQEDPEIRRCFGARFDSAKALRAWAEAHQFPPPVDVDRDACWARVDQLLGRDPPPDVVQSLQSLGANERTKQLLHVDRNRDAAYDTREAGMMDVFLAERARLGDGRTMFLAHDDHIGRKMPGYTPLGARLTAVLGDGYRALAVTGYRIESRLGPQYDQIGPPAGAPEHDWHALGRAQLLVDLHATGQAQRHDAALVVDHARRGLGGRAPEAR